MMLSGQLYARSHIGVPRHARRLQWHECPRYYHHFHTAYTHARQSILSAGAKDDAKIGARWAMSDCRSSPAWRYSDAAPGRAVKKKCAARTTQFLAIGITCRDMSDATISAISTRDNDFSARLASARFYRRRRKRRLPPRDFAT